MTGMLKEECYNDGTCILPMLDANEIFTQDLSMSGLSVKFRFFGIQVQGAYDSVLRST